MRYLVEGRLTISCSVYVEADSYEEAIETAAALPLPELCYFCSKQGEDGECWQISEFDGEPYKLHATEKA